MPKLLIVDDDEALRRLMRVELGDTYEIFDSGQPEHALAVALESRPDAILLDLRMPRYSGYELLQTFTSFSRTQMIPVVVVTGEGDAQTRERCTQLGAAAYFEKPIDFDALRVCLRRFAKVRPRIPRSEVRVRLRVPIQLRGTDAHGRQFEEPATTEEVSIIGFLCACTAELATDSFVDVYLTAQGSSYAGRAKIIHCNTMNGSLRHYGCRFVEKTGPWVLQ